MHSTYLVALFPLAAYATLYGHCSGPSDGGKATGVYLNDGICDLTTDCNHRSGSHITNGCPHDHNDVTCCVIGLGDPDTNPCGGTSYCDWATALEVPTTSAARPDKLSHKG
ncbi:hypothetical protein BGZ57DRAFT_1004417 [Hyaloscypha finlandica]|nr:hypothetical protein BGZ57DRAFT_1004417 [Hyaloscypha finlandica]KAH8786821.1 hypothetical protein F5882DRAFT_439076 [Hyaloscypha sp. PMI_1271]